MQWVQVPFLEHQQIELDQQFQELCQEKLLQFLRKVDIEVTMQKVEEVLVDGGYNF